ncbi:unnamed protein product, partial [marine sediment metagenome]
MKDAIICLGQGFYETKNLENMKSRVKKAVELIKKKEAKKIIFTGGDPSKKGIA